MTPIPEPTIAEVAAKWADLLNQTFVRIVMLEKENSQIKQENDDLAEKVYQLGRQLHQTELDLLKAQGKQIVDGTE